MGMFEQPLEDTFREQEGQSPGGKGVVAAPTALSNTKPLSFYESPWSNHLEARHLGKPHVIATEQLFWAARGPCRQSYLVLSKLLPCPGVCP